MPYAIEAGLFGDIAGNAGKEPTDEQRRIFVKAMPLVKERLVFLNEVPEKIAYLFRDPSIPETQEFIPKKSDLAQTMDFLKMGLDMVRSLAEAADDEKAEAIIKAVAEKNNVKLGDLMMPLRAAITGARVSPPLFGSMRILGAECCEKRVQNALDKLIG
jgi:glutamyl-tRNA synthetase